MLAKRYILPHRTLLPGLPGSFVRVHRRWNSTAEPVSVTPEPPTTKEGYLFVDSIFPVQLASWDLRYYIARFQQERLLGNLSSLLKSYNGHGFSVLALEPRVKDGGVFVKYQLPATETINGLELETELKDHIGKQGGIKTWLGGANGQLFAVRGHPWREDMKRFASPILKVQFEGPDVYQENLYDIFRKYGRISDITNPVPVPAGVLRSSTVTFSNIRSATRAHNCLHGFTLIDDPQQPPEKKARTRLATVYERPLKAHAVRDWLTSHPRIVVPVLVFLIGMTSYIIFDPIRTFVVQAKVLNWLDVKESRLVKWIKINTIDRINIFSSKAEEETDPEISASPARAGDEENLWKDRKEAEHSLEAYLNEAPSTIAFIHGPQGSGKTTMLERVLKNTGRRTLIIDCAELNKAKSDADVINGLANQTGYWPVFTFLNNINNMIDLASVGLIGQKAGLATSVDTQLKQILDVVANALKSVALQHHKLVKGRELAQRVKDERERERRRRREEIENGVYHDGRIDCLCGNGIMSELGVGDEPFGEMDWEKSSSFKAIVEDAIKEEESKPQEEKTEILENAPEPVKWAENAIDRVQGAVKGVVTGSKVEAEKLWQDTKQKVQSISLPLPGAFHPQDDQSAKEGEEKRQREAEDDARKKREATEDIKALPVVILKNFASTTPLTDQLINVLAEWSAGLAEGGAAHVIVLSDNRENGRRLAKALPARPLQDIALSDADTISALSYVKEKLEKLGVSSSLSRDQTSQIARLGGRASDLETLIHKVHNGLKVEDAVEDIISRALGELRKNAFGEEAEDAKGLPWSKEQVFFVFKALAKSNEIPYYDVLIDFPFKGDESALRGMEHAELISITTHEGRPSTIRPGRPVYKYVFERLVNDPTFRAVQDLAFNEKAIASAESTIKSCEQELTTLKEISPLDNGWLTGVGATRQRADFLLRKMRDAERKVEKLEKENAALKKTLKALKN